MIEIDVAIKPREIRTKKRKRIRFVRLTGCFMIFVLVLSIGGYILYTQYSRYAAANEAKVAQDIQKQLQQTASGLSVPSSDNGDPLEAHPEANANVAYSQTKYMFISDVVHGIRFKYPTNSAALIRNVDGSQVWLLRRTGYMFKLTIEESKAKLIDYYNSLSDKALYTQQKTILNQKSAFLLKQIDTTQVIVGNEYLVSYNGFIFTIWYQVYDPNKYPDDVKRIQDILDSIAFI